MYRIVLTERWKNRVHVVLRCEETRRRAAPCWWPPVKPYGIASFNCDFRIFFFQSARGQGDVGWCYRRHPVSRRRHNYHIRRARKRNIRPAGPEGSAAATHPGPRVRGNIITSSSASHRYYYCDDDDNSSKKHKTKHTDNEKIIYFARAGRFIRLAPLRAAAVSRDYWSISGTPSHPTLRKDGERNPKYAVDPLRPAPDTYRADGGGEGGLARGGARGKSDLTNGFCFRRLPIARAIWRIAVAKSVFRPVHLSRAGNSCISHGPREPPRPSPPSRRPAR